MAQPIPQPLFTEEEYLTFERDAFERREYLDGVIYAMAVQSPNHGIISTNLIRLLGNQLLETSCDIFTKDMKIRSGPLFASKRSRKGLFSYPDLVIVCGELQTLGEHEDVITNPLVIIEVLSESTMHFDRVAKFQRYQRYSPTLVDYVLVSQDQPLIEIYHRDAPDSDSWRYVSVNELARAIPITSINCQLQLSEVYYRITFPATTEDEGEPQA